MNLPKSDKRKIHNIKWYLPTLVIVFFLAVFFEKKYENAEYDRDDAKLFQETLLEKERILNAYLGKTRNLIDSMERESKMFVGFDQEFLDLYQEEGISLFYFSDNQLNFWTDNQIPLPSSPYLLPSGNTVSLGNSIYLMKMISDDGNSILGLLLIKTEHPYENRFLQNGFQEDFELGEEVEIEFSTPDSPFRIENSEGEYIFSLNFSETEYKPAFFRSVSLGLYFLFFLMLLIVIRTIVHGWMGKGKNLVIYLSIIFIILLMKIVSFYRVPSVLYDSDLFSAVKYSSTFFFFSSIGDLFTGIFIFFFIAYNFYADYQFPYRRLKYRSFSRILLLFVFLLVTITLYIFDTYVFKSLMLDSSISFETYKVLDLSVFTFIGFFMLALLYMAYALLTDKVLLIFANLGMKKHALGFIILQLVFFLILFFIPIFPYVNFESILLFAITSGLLFYFRFLTRTDYPFSNFVVFVILFSIFSLAQVIRYSEIRDRSEMKMLAVNLSAEHDPIAELLFIDMNKKIQQDQELKNIIYSPVFDFEYLYSTLERKYFSGYWDKYDLQVTICEPEDSVYVSPPDDAWYPCYPFFYEGILSDGMQVPGTEFYYLDNLNGRISYFLYVTYNEGEADEVTMFIELDSRLFAEGLGYPGLLLEDSFEDPAAEYSYAKYNNGNLITSNGEFAYSTNADVYTGKSDGFESFKFDNYDHLAYHLDESNTIIVSKPSVFWVDILISFSYIFSFYFITLIVLLSISWIGPVSMKLKPSFKNRIQLSITSVLLISFILFGAGTVYFSIQEYKARQLEILEEKVQSVYIELIHKLEFETDLRGWSSDSYYNLDELLQKFSNVFYTDINLFSWDGQLLATSRSELYDMGLLSRRMNAEAYKEMTVNKRSEFIHTETIGSLDYLSVYVPFVNANNEMLAYLNLPYFTKQDELTREIANLVVAIINIVFLLSLLSFTIAVFVSNTVTSPLRLIQQKIARISLSEKNEKINYSAKDEIGSLVNEYNHMVDQIQESAELLARSERESAWREMAKQIAHEIKNPLTPMKLSVQHLKRTYKEPGEKTDEQVDKITEMLIDQIDDLSAIATEFSNFAKMPLAKNERLNLVKKLENAIDLFKDYDRCMISLHINTKDPVYIHADREQISRVFINLIKNAIQSVPESKTGKIEVVLDRKDQTAIVTVKDNGKGIPEEIRDKLFQPNFTTKSGGMGLGLSIVRNIVRNAGGRINYETEPGKGSSFFVELPIMEENEYDQV